MVENNVNFLVGSDEEKILQLYQKCLSQKGDFSNSLYGNGQAGKNIVANIKDYKIE
ncbi:MAG: hypothetical protein M3405_14365 [Acidobacteriota bacterium]|nr:hypothetical protein [Acidobacteriota bacterium]